MWKHFSKGTSTLIILGTIFMIAIFAFFLVILVGSLNWIQYGRYGEILFEKKESWEQCPSYKICNQSTRLYYSGKLILEGEKNIEKDINAETVKKIKDRIKLAGIMDRDCWIEEPLADYSAVYNFNLDGKIRKMRYPNCQEELKKIEELIKI